MFAIFKLMVRNGFRRHRAFPVQVPSMSDGAAAGALLQPAAGALEVELERLALRPGSGDL